MVFKYQCNIDLQDCPTLYPEGFTMPFYYGLSTAHFTEQSCVRDQRLDGNVGRCGFPGAPCIINGTASNCAEGRAEVCIDGICQGAPGYPCFTDIDCNWGVNCNTSGIEGICGGVYAVAIDESADGLDYARDYCAAGSEQLVQNNPVHSELLCASGTLAYVSNPTYTLSLPASTASSSLSHGPKRSHLGPILGGVFGFVAVVSIPFAALWWMKRSRRAKSPSSGSDSSHSFPIFQSRQHEWAIRILISLILQFAYFALVIVACIRPIIFSSFPVAKLTEAKGFLTIITIVWETLALLPVGDIITTVFASEWSHSFENTKELIPGETDRVSVQTAGMLEKIKYFCASGASMAFRLAFPASLISLALAALAPGALTVDVGFVPSGASIRVGSISIARIADIPISVNTVNIQRRATLITQLEQVEGTQFGHKIDRGLIVGWPSPQSSMGLVLNMTYPSDVVRFDYSCHWSAPTLVRMAESQENKSVVHYGTWAVDGATSEEELWTVFPYLPDGLHPTNISGSGGIFPLIQMNGNLSTPRTSSYGTSAWLFIGGNSSYTRTGPIGPYNITYTLDVGDVPSTYNETYHWPIEDPASFFPEDIVVRAPLATVLVCDPRMNVSSALVTFSPTGNSLSISEKTLDSPVGNISPASAGYVLSQSLMGVTGMNVDPNSPVLTVASAKIFIKQPFDSQHSYLETAHVRSASEISSAVGSYVSSASKAWADGYWDAGRNTTMQLNAVQQEQSLVIVGNVSLVIASGILAVFLLGLVSVQLWMRWMAPLGIGSLKEALEKSASEKLSESQPPG